MQVRLGVKTAEEVTSEYFELPKGVEVIVPAYFSVAESHPLDQHRTIFWDETHKKQRLGDEPGALRYMFPRDEEGTYDPEGEVGERKVSTTLKVGGESRIAIGVGALMIGEEVIGRRARPFFYSECRIVSIKDYEVEMKALIVAAKEKGGSVWIKDMRGKNIWEKDLVTQLPGIKIVKAAALKAIGVNTVLDLKLLDGQVVVKGMSQKKIEDLQKMCSGARAGSMPKNVVRDYREDANPYLAKYGGSKWEGEAALALRSRSKNPVVCITELVTHMMEESAAMFAGGPNPDVWYLNHDALPLMTAVATKAWMKGKIIGGKTYFERWILPVAGLFDGPGLGRYKDNPPGNCPEFMPLDQSLNQDLHLALDRHAALTRLLPEEDARKFSRSTPKRQDYAYARLLDGKFGRLGEGVPAGGRIVQDVAKVIVSYGEVFGAKGTVIQGLGNRDGHRRSVNQPAARGGKREKGEYTQAWIHPDARAVVKDFIRASEARSTKAG